MVVSILSLASQLVSPVHVSISGLGGSQHFKLCKTVRQSVSQSVLQSLTLSINRSVNKSVNQPVSQPVSQSVDILSDLCFLTNLRDHIVQLCCLIVFEKGLHTIFEPSN